MELESHWYRRLGVNKHHVMRAKSNFYSPSQDLCTLEVSEFKQLEGS